ncbi:MAG TPA: RidA family protein, partial [Thermoanaerobaculia bacterium]|nr:RidA family protein [Thermoanaerobaculia bacterium]
MSGAPEGLQPVNPPALGAPLGYSNGIVAPAGWRWLFVAGQVAWDLEHRIVAEDFATQFSRALHNVLVVVSAAGGAPQHVARLTIYVTDRQEYLAATRRIGEDYRRQMG